MMNLMKFMVMNATVLNRDPYVNLTTDTPAVYAGQPITFNATDSGDIDTISPEGQYVTITWPESACQAKDCTGHTVHSP